MEDIGEIKAKIEAVKSRLSGVYKQMEDDMSTLRDLFEMDKTTGKWLSYTDNAAAALTESYRRTLADAPLRLWIEPLAEEVGDEKKSQVRTMAEQLAKGAIWLANQRLLKVPSGVDLQSGWAQDGTERGGTATRYFLRQVKEHGAWKLVSDAANWDPLNTYWVESVDGLLWACHLRYGDKEQVSDEWGTDKLVEDSYGKVAVYEVWTPEEFQVLSETGALDEPYKHGLGYIPVFIRPVGGKQQRQSTRDSNTFKDSWFSAIALNRNLYKERNFLLSLIKTQAAIQVKPPRINKYDSSKQGQEADISEIGDVNFPNAEVVVDTGQGQDVAILSLATPLPEVYKLLAENSRSLSLGGVAPVFLGILDTSQTATGTAQLGEASRQSLNPFKQNMEAQAVWLAEEVVRQYKNGEFEETELEGFEPNGKKFKVEVVPDEINDNEHFKSELKLNLMRDKISDMAYYKTGLEIGAFSRAGVQEALNDDPDLVRKQIAEEKVGDALGADLIDAFKALTTDGRGRPSLEKVKENELFVHMILRKLYEMAGLPYPEAPKQITQGGGLPAPKITAGRPPAGTEVGQVAAAPMTEQARMERMGLEVARR